MEPLDYYTVWPKGVNDRQGRSLTSNHMLSVKPSLLSFLSLYLQADHFLPMSLERRLYWKLGSATLPLTLHFWLWKIKQFLFCFVSKYYYFFFFKKKSTLHFSVICFLLKISKVHLKQYLVLSKDSPTGKWINFLLCILCFIQEFSGSVQHAVHETAELGGNWNPNMTLVMWGLM